MPLVRLFVPSEEDENTLLNLAELIGLESEKQAEIQEEEEEQEESTSAGYITCEDKALHTTLHYLVV